MLFLDEIQYVPDWQTWLKHQADFRRDRRIAADFIDLPSGDLDIPGLIPER